MQLATPADGCNITTPHQLPELGHGFIGSKVVIVNRGNCTFGVKTSQAEKGGYSLVVVVDNREERVNEVSMIDSNHSNQINIPTLLISSQDGETVLKFMRETKEDVYVQVRFDPPNLTSIVEYQYWMSAMDTESYQFIEEFSQFQEQMNASLAFTPHYPLGYCYYCMQQNWTVKNTDCLSGGRYCAYDPDSEGPLSGKDVVWQTLRQICVNQNAPYLWWSYVIAFGRQCLGTSFQVNTTEVISIPRDQI